MNGTRVIGSIAPTRKSAGRQAFLEPESRCLGLPSESALKFLVSGAFPRRSAWTECHPCPHFQVRRRIGPEPAENRPHLPEGG